MTTLKELVDSLTTTSRMLRDGDIAANPDQPELWTNEPTLFPPATPDEIDSVELRLGAHLDPLHRELLTITNGWYYYNGWQCFLSTNDILLDSPSFTLTGISWHELRTANWAFWDSLDETQHPSHPLPSDREIFIPIATPTAGYGEVSSILSRTSSSTPAPVFASGSDLSESFDNLLDYLTAELGNLKQ